MIEIKQLRQLVAISEYGTMTAAAKELFISQPALSRSIQRLENVLSVRLFDHGQNALHLNPVGIKAVEHAKSILSEVDDLPGILKAYEHSLRTITVGTCAPNPMVVLLEELSRSFPDNKISYELTDFDDLLSGLAENRYQMVVVEKEPKMEGVIYKEYMKESVFLCVSPDHPLAEKDSVRLSDLSGMTLLGFQNAGTWTRLHEMMPDVHFIVEKEPHILTELIINSTIPAFITSSHIPFILMHPDRVCIPIEDDAATIAFYLCVKARDANYLKDIVPLTENEINALMIP